MKKYGIFIASADARRSFVDALHGELGNTFKVTPWTSGRAFAHGESFMQSLDKVLEENHFAVFLFAPDNEFKEKVKGKGFGANENVVFEAGIALGKYGIKRTFFVHDKRALIPSDLKGISTFEFDSSGNEVEEMSRVAAKIRSHTKDFQIEQHLDRLLLLSLVKVAPGKHRRVTAAIRKTAKEEKGRIQIDRIGVLYGEYDDFLLFEAPNLDTSSAYISRLRKKFDQEIFSVETYPIFSRNFWTAADKIPKGSDRSNHLVLMRCAPHHVENTYKELVRLAEEEMQKEAVDCVVSDVAVIFGHYDIFLMVSADTYPAFFKFIHNSLKERIQAGWLRENTTSLQIEYLPPDA